MLTVSNKVLIAFATVLIISVGLIWWFTFEQINTFSSSQKTLLQDEVRTVASEIEKLLENRRNFVSAFAKDNTVLFEKVLANPDDDELIESVRARIDQYIPGFHAFTIRSPQGDYSPEPFGEIIGEQCQADMRTFANYLQQHAHPISYEPYIHPQPFHYHYDMMAQWNYSQGQKGIFFVSFLASELTEIIRRNEKSGHTVIISRSDTNYLIEALSIGARDKLGKDFWLSEDLINQILYEQKVDSSRWLVSGLLKPELIQHFTTQSYLRSFFASFVSLIFYLLAFALYQKLRRTEAKHISELQSAMEKAAMGSKAKSDFLSSMSHELRTPLNSILGFSQLLENNRSGNLTQKELKQVKQINIAGAHMLELVNDVLDLARIESGHTVYAFEEIQPREIFKECYELFAPIAEEKDITLQGHPLTDRTIYVDRAKFRQVLSNLLGNAVKYNKPGGTVDFGCRAHSDTEIEIFVKDTGSGIPIEDHDLIFEKFFRSKNHSENVQGTGVGLSIVKHIVEHMGGTINLKSDVGQGSEFSIIMPITTHSSFR
ncbi:HAMP domain-containing sensor histidine kinase [Terasakiella sp. A23]|uniref:sensor histidine kinase n=1 Tax=Terasakiella sp. FCG-A23 TaxID=3080561 RepID=UPI0029536A1E|nr:HAMP domain-containing sensor histidine kinase [Terasakiella sp. A23]MDV7338920.1 HAMP domain-containing sensor histidine kinase [Terasakiella sp. A23]